MQLSSHKDITGAIKHLLSVCKKRGLKADDIDASSGVSYRTIFYWRGGRDPQLSNFIFFAESLGYELVLQKKQHQLDKEKSPA